MTDWDAAYSNREHVGSDVAETIISGWAEAAAAYRAFMVPSGRCKEAQSYGEKPRNLYDIFLPAGPEKGTVIFIHGGYWRALDRSFFSHLAAGPLAHNWAVAMPSYTLAPEARIKDITAEVATSIITIAGQTQGPIRLAGHSAGGHLVARMLCEDALLPDPVYERIENTVAVSGLFDLENLVHTEMNDDFNLDAEEVKAESPARLNPRPGARLTCLVGGSELPEFLRQNELLENWRDNGASVKIIRDQGKHHFNVIEPLEEPGSLLTMAVLA